MYKHVVSKNIDNILDINFGKIKYSEINNFFDSKYFLPFYKKFIKIIIKENFSTKNTYLIQKRPTLRVFKPKERGVTFHNDFWYGHGKDTYTFWFPISGTSRGNCVYFSNKSINMEFANKLVLKMIKNKINIDNFNQVILNHSDEKVITNGYLFFDSQHLHGSPFNLSKKIRISFDLRITKYGKDYGSKDITNNFLFKKGNLFDPIKSFVGKKYLKYVVGGKFSTQSQHIFINSFAKEKNLIISEQDQEMERFDFPVLKKYLLNSNKKRFDGIIIFSKDSIDKKIYNRIKKGFFKSQKIIFACENEFFPIESNI